MATLDWLKETTEGPTDLSGLQRRYARTFVMKLDSDTTVDDARLKFIAQGYGWGATHPENANAIFIGSDVRHKNGSLQVFDATAYYQTRVPGRVYQELEDASTSETPTDWTPTIRYGFQPRPAFFERDYLNNPIDKTNGLPFEPVEDVVYDMVASVRWYKPITGSGRFNANTFKQYIGTVNADDWHSLTARTALWTQFSADPTREAGAKFWELNAEITIREAGWDIELLHAGYMERINPGSLLLQRITDNDGLPVREPFPLDIDGTALPLGGTRQYKTVQLKPQTNFKNILPNFDQYGEYVS